MNNPSINHVSVDSSSLASVGYDQGLEVLEVAFKSGAVYRYEDVPGLLYDGLLSADSKGAFFNRRVRDLFRFQRNR